MLGRLSIRLRNMSFLIHIFCVHLYRKWNPDTNTIGAIVCMIISSILFPILVCYLFYKDPSYIEQTILIYMAVTIWSTSILVILNQRICNRIKAEVKYVFRLIKFIDACHSSFIMQYRKWVKHHLVRKDRHDEFEKYDICVVDTILMEVFHLYFNNINNKLKDNIPFVVSADKIQELSNDKQFNNFYSSIFFDIEEKEEKCTIDTITIKIIDAVMQVLYTKTWFEDYWDNEVCYKFIQYIINRWFENIGYLTTYKLMENKSLAV